MLWIVSCNLGEKEHDFSVDEKKKLEARISQDNFTNDSIHIFLKKSTKKR